MRYFHILNLNKPQGITSRAAVDCVQRLVRPAKVGHAGTLDPLATGVLVVCLGQATRLIDVIQQQRKCYTATFLLGRRSDTDDVEGTIEELVDAPRPTRADLKRVLPQFVGQIQQRPPTYSAVKVQGQRAYRLARRGHEVELAPRPVEVFSLSIDRYEYPELVATIKCGSGTYVRAIGRDLAAALGTAAVMSALTRTSIGDFRVEDAVAPADLSRENLAQHLMPAARAVSDWPRVTLSVEERLQLTKGLHVALPSERVATNITTAAAYDEHDELASLLVRTAAGDWRPERNFASEIHLPLGEGEPLTN